MTPDEMIALFLEHTPATQIANLEEEYTDDKFNRTKGYRSNKDYIPDPMWDNTLVTDGNITIQLTVYKHKVQATSVRTKDIVGMCWTYDAVDVSNGIHLSGKLRENTITERISSGEYKLIKKD